LGFFPPYFAAPVVRQDLLDEDPAVADVLNAMAGMIDDETMADLNAQVDVDGEEPEDVARGFLEEQRLIAAK
jgi:glycine betaine/choline ABC-type transport system substrate-binding protein